MTPTGADSETPSAGAAQAPVSHAQPAPVVPVGGLAGARLALNGSMAQLRRRRYELAERVSELTWDLGGLTYEMAIRDHYRLDVLARRAAELQRADAELAEVQRLLASAEAGVAGPVPLVRRRSQPRSRLLLALRRAAAARGAARRARSRRRRGRSRRRLGPATIVQLRRAPSPCADSLRRMKRPARPSRARTAALARAPVLARGGGALALAVMLAPISGALARIPARSASAHGPREYGCPMFPAGNPLNREIAHAPVNPLSAQYIASIGSGAPACRLRQKPRVRHPLRGRGRQPAEGADPLHRVRRRLEPRPLPDPRERAGGGRGRGRRQARARAAARCVQAV